MATALGVITLVACMYLVALVAGLKPSDDQTYLYTIGYQVTAPSAYAEVVARNGEEMSREGFSGEILKRFEFRADYAANYFMHGLAVAAVKSIVPAVGHDHGQWTYWVNQAAVGLAALLAMGLLAVLILKLPQQEAEAVLLALAAAGLAAILPTIGWRFLGEAGLKDIVLAPLKAAYFMVQPGMEFDAFGPTPRNVAVLLVLGALVARVLDRPALQYWILAAAATCHATYGGLALAIFLTLDLALTPGRLRRPVVLAPVLAAAGWFGVFGLRFEAFDQAAVIGMVALAGLLIAALAAPWTQSQLKRLPPFRLLRAVPARAGEAIVLVLIAVGFLTLSIALNLTLRGDAQTYIAAELAGRPLSIIRVPLAACLALLAWPLLRARLGRIAPITLALVVAATSGLALTRAVRAYTPPQTSSQLIAALHDTPVEVGRSFGKKELAIYYATARELDGLGPVQAGTR